MARNVPSRAGGGGTGGHHLLHSHNGSLILTKNQQKIHTPKPLPNQSFAATAAARKAKAASVFKNDIEDSSSSESLDEDSSTGETESSDEEDDEGFVKGPVQRFVRNGKSQQLQKSLKKTSASSNKKSQRTGPASNLQKTPPKNTAKSSAAVKNKKGNNKKRQLSDDDEYDPDESPKKKAKRVNFQKEPEFMPISSSIYDENSVTESDDDDDEDLVSSDSELSEEDGSDDQDSNNDNDDDEDGDEDADSVLAEEEMYMVETEAGNADFDIMKIMDGAYGFSSPEWSSDLIKEAQKLVDGEEAGLKAPANTPIRTPSRRRSSIMSNSSAGSDDEFPWFDRDDSALKYVINTHGYFDDELDELELEGDVFYSSADDGTDGGSSCEESGSTTDDDATDLDETPVVSAKARKNDPLPRSEKAPNTAEKTPQKGTAAPIGPKLGSFVCDPSRLICLIDGKNETVFLHPRWLSESSDCAVTGSRTESDCDYSGPSRRQSTTSGDPELASAAFTPAAFSARNMDNTLVPNALFSSPCHHLGEVLYSSSEEYDFEDEASEIEDEHEKLIDKYLELSSSEGESDDGGEQDTTAIELTPRRPSTASSVNATPQEAMLSRWDQVSVTAFRKRQIEHQQRIKDGKQNVYGHGVYKGRINRANFNVTPTRKKKSKNNFKVPMKPRPAVSTPTRRQSYYL